MQQFKHEHVDFKSNEFTVSKISEEYKIFIPFNPIWSKVGQILPTQQHIPCNSSMETLNLLILMTLFPLLFYRSHCGHFSERLLKNIKRKYFQFWLQRIPPLKKIYEIISFPKNHGFSTWIWILFLTFFKSITYVLLKILKFSLF